MEAKTRLQQEFADRDMAVPVRLNKYLSEAGVCSRREADRLIEAGEVLVDGKPASTGTKILPSQRVTVRGQAISRETEMVLLAVNKPRGVVCTTEKRWGDTTVEDMLHYPKRVFYIGRLDKDSEGLLLMTNDGEILNKILRAGNYHEKEYEVTVDKPVTKAFLDGLAKGGIPILDQKTRPCKVRQTGERSFRIILTQGLNRQIRRMCEHFGWQVVRLRRIRIMNIRLGDLKPGCYREVTRQEQEVLHDLIKGSYSAPKSGKGKKEDDR
ncbi:MAG: pseudouridine synthase [Eubacteriales bacterium]|nr:pseudouridine synthase [Eubacteriales bacterium]